jgi:PPE-repeat protein
MSTYQAVATAAVASAPKTDPAPQIVNNPRPADGEFGGGGDSGILPIIDNDAGDPYALSWWINRFLEVPQTLWRDVELIAQNPTQGFTQLFADVGGLASDEFGHALQAIEYFPQLLALPLVLPAAAAGGVAGLSGLAGIQMEAAPAPDVPAATPQPHSLPSASNSPAAVGVSTSPGTTSASVSPSTASSVVSSAATTPPPAGGGPGFVPPYAVGPPGIGVGSGMSSSAGSGAKKKGSEPEGAVAAAAAIAQAHRRTRRRRLAGMRGYGHEFMEMNINVDPDWGVPPQQAVASDQGAGPLGFAGTVRKEAVPAAAGLMTLDDDEFGGGPSMPIVPGSWNPERG